MLAVYANGNIKVPKYNFICHFALCQNKLCNLNLYVEFYEENQLGLLSSLSSTEIRGPDLPRYEHYVLLLLIISVC